MENIIKAIVYGIIQGLTEFIPISSTAHIRVVPALLGWSDPVQHLPRLFKSEHL